MFFQTKYQPYNHISEPCNAKLTYASLIYAPHLENLDLSKFKKSDNNFNSYISLSSLLDIL